MALVIPKSALGGLSKTKVEIKSECCKKASAQVTDKARNESKSILQTLSKTVSGEHKPQQSPRSNQQAVQYRSFQTARSYLQPQSQVAKQAVPMQQTAAKPTLIRQQGGSNMAQSVFKGLQLESRSLNQAKNSNQASQPKGQNAKAEKTEANSATHTTHSEPYSESKSFVRLTTLFQKLSPEQVKNYISQSKSVPVSENHSQPALSKAVVVPENKRKNEIANNTFEHLERSAGRLQAALSHGEEVYNELAPKVALQTAVQAAPLTFTGKIAKLVSTFFSLISNSGKVKITSQAQAPVSAKTIAVLNKISAAMQILVSKIASQIVGLISKLGLISNTMTKIYDLVALSMARLKGLFMPDEENIFSKKLKSLKKTMKKLKTKLFGIFSKKEESVDEEEVEKLSEKEPASVLVEN